MLPRLLTIVLLLGLCAPAVAQTNTKGVQFNTQASTPCGASSCMWTESTGVKVMSTAADGASAAALSVNTSTGWVNAGARLLDIFNNSVLKIAVATDGTFHTTDANIGFRGYSSSGVGFVGSDDNTNGSILSYGSTFARVQGNAVILNANAGATRPNVDLQDTLGDATHRWSTVYTPAITAGASQNVTLNAGASQHIILAPGGAPYFRAAAGAFYPESDLQSSLGLAGGRWTTVYSPLMQDSTTVKLKSAAADGATAVAAASDTTTAWTNPASSLFDFRNNGVTKSWIDPSGQLRVCAGCGVVNPSNSRGVAIDYFGFAIVAYGPQGAGFGPSNNGTDPMGDATHRWGHGYFGTDAIGTAQTESLTINNVTAATSGAQQYSPMSWLYGTRYNGAASKVVGYGWQAQSSGDGTDAGSLALYSSYNGTPTKRLTFEQDATFGVGYETLTLVDGNVFSIFDSVRDGISMNPGGSFFTYINGNAVTTTTTAKHGPTNAYELTSGAASVPWSTTYSRHYASAQGAAPTCAPNAAAGTGGSVGCAVASGSTDTVGTLTITSGSSGVTTGDFATITFNTAWGQTPRCVVGGATNATQASIGWATATNQASGSATTAVIAAGTAPTINSNYTYSYHCFEGMAP